ncbi:MAG: ABC transporter ATP-binding protein [Thermoprotei archaeon]|nr:MAG: ABC transporter ATP-binding protein [Thermoprotei archaeon]
MLTVDNVHKRFGGLKALDGVYMEVEKGTITSIIGPNGSGKSTLINVITALYEPDEGDIRFNGSSIRRLKPHQVFEKGIVRTFQVPRIFPRMTVLENMMLAPRRQTGEGITANFFRWKKVDAEEEEHAKKALEILKFLGLAHLKNELAMNLSGGQMKLLELGRALMADPTVLLLDEPVAGVNPTLARKIFDAITTLRREQGLTFLIVEHNVDLLVEYSDHLYVMHRGKVVLSGHPKEVIRSPKVMDIYLGEV